MTTADKLIDLRSDTVTAPTKAMRAVMASAPVGDDVYGEDPTVNRLEAQAAELLGFEAAVFAPSGTQSNLLALLSYCQRGDEYIVGQQAHTYKYEGGGAAVLGSIVPQPLEFEADGSLSLERVRQAIKPDDIHFARSRLLCLENTQGGKVLSLDYLQRSAVFAGEHKLALHLDGARVFNAAVSQQVSVAEITQHFDSVSICLSKGLGAPLGSLLCASQEHIVQARRWRKMLGGGMRQAGIVAAAGIYALENNVERLAEDHQHASQLVLGLADIDGVETLAHSNMVFAKVGIVGQKQLPEFLHQRGIRISGGETIRLVTHLDISAQDVSLVVAAFKDFFAANA